MPFTSRSHIRATLSFSLAEFSIQNWKKTDIVHETRNWCDGSDDDVASNSQIPMWRVQSHSHRWGIDYRLFPSTNVLFTKQ